MRRTPATRRPYRAAMTRAMLAAPVLLGLAVICACASAPRPQAALPAQAPAGDEAPEPLPDGIVPLTREQDERLSQ